MEESDWLPIPEESAVEIGTVFLELAKESRFQVLVGGPKFSVVEIRKSVPQSPS
jgi:hypothetical protein